MIRRGFFIARDKARAVCLTHFPTEHVLCHSRGMTNATPPHDPAQSPERAVQNPSPHSVRHDGWTIEKQLGFLQMLNITHNVAAAARSVGMGRQSAYKLRSRLDNAPFGAAWRKAMHNARDVLVEAALERAIHGVEIPHYWQGEKVGTSRRFDERLTIALLASGALEPPRQTPSFVENEYAQQDLTRLLDRIAQGPAHWCDFEQESDYACGGLSNPDEETGPLASSPDGTTQPHDARAKPASWVE